MRIIIGIYKIVCIKTDKVYIGQSTNILRRFDYYKRLQCKNQRKLYNSLKKYGVKNHKFEILEECLLEQLNEREIYWTELLEAHTKDNGLVLKVGGFKGYSSEETKEKLSKSQKGNKYREGKILELESKIKISKANRGKSHPSNRKGKKIKGNFRKKLKESKKIFKNPVAKMDLKENILQIYDSIIEASKSNKIPGRGQGIYECCKGKIKTCHGFKWKYINKQSNNPHKRKIIQEDLNGNIIQEFDSINEASRFYNIDKNAIIKCCKGKYEQYFDSKWKYK